MKAAQDMSEDRKKELVNLADRHDSTSGERYDKAARAIGERLGVCVPAEQAPKLEFLSHPQSTPQSHAGYV